MRHIRATFCGFSFVVAILALIQHLGFDLWNCASCSLVNELPVSSIIAWVGPFLLAGLTYTIYKDLKWANYMLGVAAVGSLSLVAWMIRNNTICLMCILVHIGVLAATLTLIPRTKFLGPLFFSLAIAFTATDGWEKFMITSEYGIFRPRDRETIPGGKVYILFTDPECSRCQIAESQISKLENKPQIIYRWCLLPQKMYRSIRAAAMLEMARMQSAADFERLRLELFKETPPLTDAALIAIATRAGLADKVKSWLDNPTERALVAIEDDQTSALELKIQTLPALAELSEPDATGSRTIRQVPFSAIGINP